MVLELFIFLTEGSIVMDLLWYLSQKQLEFEVMDLFITNIQLFASQDRR